MKWPSIYDDNKPVIEKAAQTYGHPSSRHGRLIFGGTRVKVKKREGLLSMLPPKAQQGVGCAAEVFVLWRTGAGGLKVAARAKLDIVLLKRVVTRLAKAKPLTPAQKQAWDRAQKLLGAVNSCEDFAAGSGGLLGTLHEAAAKFPKNAALEDALLLHKADQCADSLSKAFAAGSDQSLVNRATAIISVLRDCGDAADAFKP